MPSSGLLGGFSQGSFAACGRRPSFSMAKKKAKRPRGRLRMGAPRPYSPFPGPRCGERVPAGFCSTSGAQNLSGGPRFLPAHFVVADFVSLASPGSGKARSLHRSSSPTQTRYAGLCVGGRLRRPIWVENYSQCGSTTVPGFAEPTKQIHWRREPQGAPLPRSRTVSGNP